MTRSLLSERTTCPRCGAALKVTETARGLRRSCVEQCGRWASRKTDAQIAAAVTDLWRGMPWREISALHHLDPVTLKTRAQLLGLELPEGRRRTIKPMRLAIPEAATDLAYLAGIIDGEGTISLKTVAEPRAYVIVSVANTSAELRAWLAPIGGTFHDRSPDEARLGNKPIWNWWVRGRLDCLALLEAIEPYMVIKRAKARDAVAVLREWDSRLVAEDVPALNAALAQLR
jgi:hypothetical protein